MLGNGIIRCEFQLAILIEGSISLIFLRFAACRRRCCCQTFLLVLIKFRLKEFFFSCLERRPTTLCLRRRLLRFRRLQNQFHTKYGAPSAIIMVIGDGIKLQMNLNRIKSRLSVDVFFCPVHCEKQNKTVMNV